MASVPQFPSARTPRTARRPTPDPRRAAIYFRVSTGPQAEHGYGLEAQEQACRALAAREGLTVAEVLRDVESVTAWDLPGLQRLLDLAEAGAIGAAVVYDPDRLSRSLAKYVWLDSRLSAAGVTVHYVTVGTAATEEQRLFHDIKAVFAQWDHRRIVHRLAQGKRTKVAGGRNHGVGVAPYGYRYERDDRGRQTQLARDPAEAPIVQRIFRAVPRCSLDQIATALRAEGIPTRHGRPWSTATLHTILA